MTTSSSTSSRSSSSANPADNPWQQTFDAWLGGWTRLAESMRTPGADMAQGQLSPFAAFTAFQDQLKKSMPTLPDHLAAPFAGLQLPLAAIAPERLTKLQTEYSREALALVQQAARSSGEVPQLKDKRFAGEAWQASPAHAFAAAWYLLQARYLHALADAVDADSKTRERIRFTVQQWTAAMAPSNFLALNPDAQRNLLETRGESLRQGLMNLLADMQRGKISQTDESQFVVGENLANTPGAVVFENDLIQLIQYKPVTPTVHERPLLIVPPCINKFYILDLQPENSLVAYALSQGQQVYLVSWRNADASVADKTWDDYIEAGVLAAIDVVQQISGRDQINTLGFCVGGTLLATGLSVLAARGEHPAGSLTLLTTMLDFADTGILDVFVDEAHVQMREQSIGGKGGTAPGLLRGVELANTFSFLRPNELVWNYVVDNYLKGRTPPPFDLLYWNGDSTSLPGPMYAWYLRHTYLQNELREPGALTVCGEPVDLSSIDVPTFIYGSRDDHIVPWKSAYASTGLLSGPLQFVLGASGHIAGVINPPAKNKRSYWKREDGALPDTSDEWFAAAEEHPGSWWPTWSTWLAEHAGRRVKPRAQLGSARFPVIEPAPGRYVLKHD